MKMMFAASKENSLNLKHYHHPISPATLLVLIKIKHIKDLYIKEDRVIQKVVDREYQLVHLMKYQFHQLLHLKSPKVYNSNSSLIR
jgi:hypothetical protein